MSPFPSIIWAWLIDDVGKIEYTEKSTRVAFPWQNGESEDEWMSMLVSNSPRREGTQMI
jgi:hypothetical protein